MGPERIETWTFTRSRAAEITEIAEGTVGNWLTRYNLFPEKKQGTGYHNSFLLSDLMTLAAMKLLVDFGVAPEKAAAPFRNFGGPYRSLLHDGSIYSRFPGTFSLTVDKDGSLQGADGPDKILAIEIRAWPLFDKLWPKVKASIVEAPGRADLEQINNAIAAFEERISVLRNLRWEAI